MSPERITKKDVKKQLLQAKKMLLEFERARNKMKWGVTRFLYKRKEVTYTAYCLGFLTILLLPLKLNAVWAAAFVKTSVGAGAMSAAGGAGAVSVASIMTVSAIHSHKVVLRHDDPPILPPVQVEQVVINKQNTQATIRKPVSFTPKKGKIILIKGDEIEGVIVDMTSEYVIIVNSNGERAKYNQELVFRVQ